MIMVYLDPSNMLIFLLTSRAPMASFKKNPLKFINLSSDVGHKRSRIHYYAMFILAKPACLEIAETEEQWSQDADEQWVGFFREAIKFDEWLTENMLTAPVPDVLCRQPLKSLKTLARVHEAVEFLIASRLWASLDLSKYGIDVHPEQGSERTCFSKADIIRECLWYFQLYCVAFPGPRLVDNRHVFFPKVRLDFEAIANWRGSRILDPSAKSCYGQICNELLKPLQTVFEHNCAIDFRTSIYKSLPNLTIWDLMNNRHHHLINDQLKNQAYWEKGLAKKSYIIFRGDKGHQLPLGIPFLAWMRRISALTVQTHEIRPIVQKWRTWLYGSSFGSDQREIVWRRLEKIRGHGYRICRQSNVGDQEFVFLLTPYGAPNHSFLLRLDSRAIGLWCKDKFKSVQLALEKLA